uniref:Putative secreted protein n=1 Tax=Ixodes ricinus TaxID=34613 RepID=A0A6B0UV53_IXORI
MAMASTDVTIHIVMMGIMALQLIHVTAQNEDYPAITLGPKLKDRPEYVAFLLINNVACARCYMYPETLMLVKDCLPQSVTFSRPVCGLESQYTLEYGDDVWGIMEATAFNPHGRLRPPDAKRPKHPATTAAATAGGSSEQDVLSALLRED